MKIRAILQLAASCLAIAAGFACGLAAETTTQPASTTSAPATSTKPATWLGFSSSKMIKDYRPDQIKLWRVKPLPGFTNAIMVESSSIMALQPGMVVTDVDGKRFKSIDEFVGWVAAQQEGKSVTLVYWSALSGQWVKKQMNVKVVAKNAPAKPARVLNVGMTLAEVTETFSEKDGYTVKLVGEMGNQKSYEIWRSYNVRRFVENRFGGGWEHTPRHDRAYSFYIVDGKVSAWTKDDP